MKVINLDQLIQNKHLLQQEFANKKPFRYLIIENFLHPTEAEKILQEYPAIDKEKWVDSNNAHSKKKWAQPCVKGSIASEFYEEVNSDEFLKLLSEITGIPNLLADEELNGAGYHQILSGGFLNVHIDFNRHKGLERRLNLIVYMNKNWQENYGGYLELWDMQKKQRIENIAPNFNRCVIFETNEVSYHGHPQPLNTGNITRKSLSVYYYTQGREDIAPAPAHNTIFINTRGKTSAIMNKINYFVSRLKKSILKKLRK